MFDFIKWFIKMNLVLACLGNNNNNNNNNYNEHMRKKFQKKIRHRKKKEEDHWRRTCLESLYTCSMREYTRRIRITLSISHFLIILVYCTYSVKKYYAT